MTFQTQALGYRAVCHRTRKCFLVVAVKAQFSRGREFELLRIICLMGIVTEGTQANGHGHMLKFLVSLDSVTLCAQLTPFGQHFEAMLFQIRGLMANDTRQAIGCDGMDKFLFCLVGMTA